MLPKHVFTAQVTVTVYQLSRRMHRMRSICVIAFALVMSAPNWVQVAEAQTGQAAPATSPPAANSAAPAVAEQADRLLKQMGDYVGSGASSSPSMPILPSTMCCRPARSCNTRRPKTWRCNALAGSMSNGAAISATGSSGTTARQSPCMIHATPFYANEAAPAEMDGMLEKLVTQLELLAAAGRLSLS